MKTIDKNLFRQLGRMMGQSVAIAFLVGCAVCVFVGAVSTYNSLARSRDEYYSSHRFADVFATCKRAPESAALPAQSIPGVSTVETRVVAPGSVMVEGFSDPVKGTFISIPRSGQPALNMLYMRSGGLPAPGSTDGVVVSDPFAMAHHLRVGDTIAAVISGHRKDLVITGTALSPEYLIAIGPGDFMPDDKRYGIFWILRPALSAMTNMDGAFNDISLDITHGASEAAVIAELDRILEPYGGHGAGGRDTQMSNKYFSDQLRGLKSVAIFIPTVFLAVVAFLLNIVMTRVIGTQREQIASLKAFGYTNTEVGLHYAKMTSVIILAGAIAGVGFGWWLGIGWTAMYAFFYRLPTYIYDVNVLFFIEGALLAFAAGMIGVFGAVRRAVSLPPAEAMRPEAPAAFHPTFIDRAGLGRHFSQPARIVLRNIERSPVRGLLSIIGIAFAVSTLVVGFYFRDAFDYIIDLQFRDAQQQDVSASFFEAEPESAAREILSMPGVEDVEGYRIVPVILRSGNLTYRTTISGLSEHPRLYRPMDATGKPIAMPETGIMLTDELGKVLGIKVGDTINVEVQEGRHPRLDLAVSAFSHEMLGVAAWMTMDNLNRVMEEGPLISGAHIRIDSTKLDTLMEEMKRRPKIAGLSVKQAMLDSFKAMNAQSMLYMAGILVFFAAAIAGGVVYNNIRVSFSEKQRELGTLRVIGMTRGEVGFIILCEMAIYVALAIPLGCLLGYLLAWFSAAGFATDLYRLPVVIYPSTYLFSASIVVLAAIATSLAIRRRINRLDLVDVLKTKE